MCYKVKFNEEGYLRARENFLLQAVEFLAAFFPNGVPSTVSEFSGQLRSRFERFCCTRANSELLSSSFADAGSTRGSIRERAQRAPNGGLVRTPMPAMDSAEIPHVQRLTKKAKGKKARAVEVEIALAPALKRLQNLFEMIDGIPCTARTEEAWQKARSACFTIVEDWQNLLKLGEYLSTSKETKGEASAVGVRQRRHASNPLGNFAGPGKDVGQGRQTFEDSKGEVTTGNEGDFPLSARPAKGHKPSPLPFRPGTALAQEGIQRFVANGLPRSVPSAAIDVAANVESVSGRTAESSARPDEKRTTQKRGHRVTFAERFLNGNEALTPAKPEAECLVAAGFFSGLYMTHIVLYYSYQVAFEFDVGLLITCESNFGFDASVLLLLKMSAGLLRHWAGNLRTGKVAVLFGSS